MDEQRDIFEDALVARINIVCGKVVLGTRDLLHILTRPDVIEFTKDYIESRDHG